MEHKQQESSNDVSQAKKMPTPEPSEKKEPEDGEVVPGASIVRSNTPRPLSYELMISSGGQYQGVPPSNSVPPIPTFPARAPSAPPLPEELGEREQAGSVPVPTPQPLAAPPAPPAEAQEFIWLFEYGLEMDAAILNSPERLDGLALLYGPAVLKGYTLILGAQRIHGSTGPAIIAIRPDEEPDAEVWGVLYRIPQRLAEPNGGDPSLLDTIHAAILPQKFFEGVQVVVYETYREREITSVTYVATDLAYQQLQFTQAEQGGDEAFMQRLAAIARKQKLPASYIDRLCGTRDRLPDEPLPDEQILGQRTTRTSTPHRSLEESTLPMSPYASHSSHVSEVRGHTTISLSHPGASSALHSELDTEPLPATFKERLLPSTDFVPKSVLPSSASHPSRWLMAFALYLVILLLLALTFAIAQGIGFGDGVFNHNFTPLGVPWLVLMYGLLGGCISSIVTLGRLRLEVPPTFVIITWFTRPFIGVTLALLSYVLLTSGIFSWNEAISRHATFFSLAGALAGMCEGWIFFRRSW
ncbi:gamma-glutamylcyclotransferase family protein [Dictyobacter arantiisoli]|uniref:Uncharacterized protein n=1 Tax=Dictyobacter arantiisoli TaxID=2014874 RepID=A0A5A5T5F6_9CHLR|nr:gamma-glutamylcyclotransferase family protein [Dictyobacter arantiisoli]GCF06640.1 hypothetical protein KDI_02040 [Dictyobacter arantiisoli]